ncbi:MAG TPA: hypothetical protein VIX35_08580 [Vicinamibacterales bacterium]
MPNRLRAVLLILTTVLAMSCGTTSPSTPLTGTWAGTLTDSVYGAGTFTSTITEVGTNLTGSYTDTFPKIVISGSVEGTVNGSGVTLTITPSAPLICPVTETGTLNSTNTSVSGTYASLSTCTATQTTGTFSGTITAGSGS